MKRFFAALALCAALVVANVPLGASAIATPAPTPAFCTPPSPLPTTGGAITAPQLVNLYNHAEQCPGQVGDIFTDGPFFNPTFTWTGGSLSFSIPLNVWSVLGNRVYTTGTGETAPASTTSYWWIDNSTQPGTIRQTSSLTPPNSTSILAYTIVANGTGITAVSYMDTASTSPVYASLVLNGSATLGSLALATPLPLLYGGSGEASPHPSATGPITHAGTYPDDIWGCTTCALVQPTASPSATPGSMAVTQKIAAGNLQAAPTGYSGDTTQIQIGDILAAQSSTNGRIWLGQAATGYAAATVYLGLAQYQAAPQVGDVITITINGTAVPYTVTSGDTTLGTLATNIASAILASSVNTIVSASAGTSSVTITALTAGYTGRYTIAVSLSGGSKETLGTRSRMDIPGNYIDYFSNLNGFTFSTDLGNYTFDDSGNIQGLGGADLDLMPGPGAPSHALIVNKNSPGNFGGVQIYDGGTNLGVSLQPFDQSTFTGPVYASPCAVTSSHCTAAPAHPGYLSPWINPDGTPTQGTQHSVLALCSMTNVVCAAGLMTITFAVPWTSATSYGCTVTSEEIIASPPYIDTKTTTELEFTFPSTVTDADAICSGY